MLKLNSLQKNYTISEKEYQLKIPMDVEVLIPSNDCVRLISRIVEEMDLTVLMNTYERQPSVNHVSPVEMLKVLLYAYHEGIDVSSRLIESKCRRDVNYMYLIGGKTAPDHATIARFRSEHFTKCAQDLLKELVLMLYGFGQITADEVFVDGTKIEANANRYTFVWKKRLTKNQARFLQKVALIVEDVIHRNGFKELRKHEVRKKDIEKILEKLKKKAEKENLKPVHGRGNKKPDLQKDIEDLSNALEKIREYEDGISICGDRNSYSKTDHDATFMHMKDDYMKNGQLKPAYNLQHAVNSGYVVGVGIFSNPGDVLTLIPFMKQIEENLGFRFGKLVADAGYESEENLRWLEQMGIEAFIKPSNYEQLGTKKFEKLIGRHENMEYDSERDCYICHNGKELPKVDERTTITKSGYERTSSIYKCSECDGCPYREQCCSGANWKRPVEERYKSLNVSREFERLRADEYERINSEEGKMLRMNRSIQVEGSFGDIKWDSRFTRYLCRGKDKVLAESILYAMGHNIGALHSRIQNDWLDVRLYELKESA